MIALIGIAYASTSIPPKDQAALAQTTIIYYSNGRDEIARLATQNRENVELANVPIPVRQAVLSAEDRTFYTNSGVDPTSIARAALSNLRGNSEQGGSTISQQYVKNLYNQRERSYKRKFKEIFLAVKINRSEDKDQILERYLNTIYLGRGAYGIQAATHAYFGANKSVSDLTVSQGAFLAGIINAPSLADPRGGAEERARAERRWNVVLDAMVQNRWLDPAARAKLKFPKTIVQATTTTSVKGQNAYLKEMVEDELVQNQDLKLNKDQIETGGYKIVTTFNKNLVDAGVRAVKEQLPADKPKGLRVGMASIDPKSGAVRAIYGGSNILKQQNQATKDRAQGGSTFKAFGLISALEDGTSLKTSYSSASPMFFKGYKKPIRNFGNEQEGYVDLVKATTDSINTVFVQLNHDVGEKKTQAAAWAAGLPRDTPDLKANLTNVLGSANVHPIDMAGAYATFAAQGMRRTPYSVQSVSYIGTKKVIWDVAGKTKGRRVFDEDAVADLSYALQQVVQHGTATYVRTLGRPVAGKTGTSNDSKSAWFVGYTPQLATAVAMHQVGKNGTTILPISGFGGVGNVTGGSFPARIWTDYMKVALQGKEVLEFPPPTFGGEVTATPPPTVAPTTPPPPSNPTKTTQPTPSKTTTPTPSTTVTVSPTRTRFPISPPPTGNGNENQ